MILEFENTAVEWRGPAPFVFVPVPAELAQVIQEAAAMLSYGWGCIPATLQVGQTRVTTSLFPRNGTYFVPIKVAIQRNEDIRIGDLVSVHLELEPKSKKM